jgi:hypothetical protein
MLPLSWSLDHVFAFGTPQFISSEAVGFILEFSRKVIIQGFPVQTVLPALLKGADSFGMHSSIIHITGAKFFEYRWTHPTLAPNGQRLALQCTVCHRLRSLNRKVVNQEMAVFRCAGKNSGVPCPGVLELKMLAGFKESKMEHPLARWMFSELDISSLQTQS